MTSAATEDGILADVSHVLARFLGRDCAGGIDRGTKFFADLGLASIDAVVLGEALESHYPSALAVLGFDGRNRLSGRSGLADGRARRLPPPQPERLRV